MSRNEDEACRLAESKRLTESLRQWISQHAESDTAAIIALQSVLATMVLLCGHDSSTAVMRYAETLASGEAVLRAKHSKVRA